MPLSATTVAKNRLWPLMLAACLIVFAPPGGNAAGARDILIKVVAVESGILTYEVSLGEKPVGKILDSLEDGLPTRIVYAIELWQQRSRWFDRLVTSSFMEFAISYDPWADEYHVESPDLSERVFIDPDDLVHWLSQQGPLELPLEDELDPENVFYVAIGAHVEPLSAEQVVAVERWLGGDKDGGEEPPIEADHSRRGIREYIMGLILDISGMGALHVTGRSESFLAGTGAQRP